VGGNELVTVLVAGWFLCDAASRPVRDSGVRVEDGRIVQTGTREELLATGDADIIDRPDCILLPGFVNGHVHLYGTLAHGIPMSSAPSGFWSFLEDYWWPRIENRLDHDMIEAATDYVCAEMLRTGTTSFFDILEAPGTLPDGLQVEKAVAERRGIRGVVTFEACERIDRDNGQLGLAENRNLIEASRPTDLIQGAMSIHTTFTCSPGFIQSAFEIAADKGVVCHAHVNEGVHEGKWCEDNFGKRTLEHYRDLGVAGPGFLASQCVQMTAVELDIIAETGIRVTHMPLSNCEVGGGIAPIPELLGTGTTIGLGTDGYVNDMFEVMRSTFLIHKARLLDPGAMPAHDVLHMATAGAADAIGIEGAGRLDIGSHADLQLVDATFPTPVEEHNLLEQLVLWRNGSHVRDVMVAGRWRVTDGELVDTDIDQLLDATRHQSKRLWAGS